MKRGLPIVCWMTPSDPCGGKEYEGGLLKLGLNATLLFGVSKLGWLKILKACMSKRRWNRSVSLRFLNTAISTRDWNGLTKMLRLAVPNPVSTLSPSGIPFTAGFGVSKGIPNAAGLRTGLPG